jgi:hypothetical protein
VKVTDCYYWPFGKVVVAAALLGRLDDAVRLCGRCQRALGDHADPLTRLHFCADMGVLFDLLLAAGRDTVLVRFHGDEVPGRRPNGRSAVAEVREWLRQQAIELAGRFDRRNGTDYFAELLRDRAAVLRFARAG